MRYIIEMTIMILLIWLTSHMIILFHEFGHALMYRIFWRRKDWRIKTGRGRQIVNLPKLSISIKPIGGFCEIYSEDSTSSFNRIIFYLGGPLLSLVGMMISIGLLKFVEQTYIEWLLIIQPGLLWLLKYGIIMNLWLFIITIIPKKGSDGYKILKIIKEKIVQE